MATKMTLAEVVRFAGAQMAAQNFRDALPVWANETSASVEIRRTHSVQGAVNVSFNLDYSNKSAPKWAPIVRVNVPAINSDVMTVTAFSALLQELTMFAASLQVQLNEFDIPVE